MYLLLNGSFGIGKSTVARQLRSALPDSAIFDPEWIGLALMRLSFRNVSDFQDLPRWRRLTIAGAKLVGLHRSTVIIPMAFSEITYLDEIRQGLAATGRPVRHFCLTAPLDVVQRRLTDRGNFNGSWVQRRAIECVEAHRSPRFSVHVETEARSPSEIAVDIAGRLGPR